MRAILFTFIASVFAEIALFILVGNAIGVMPTLLFIIISGALGIGIAKKYGVKSFQAIQTKIAQGQPPGVALIEAFMIFVGAVLLIIPGFLTSIIGLMMLTSFTRNLFKPLIFMWLRKKMKKGQVIIVQK
ncbi:FxsA family protein [Lysinibacillus sp. 54212]|uniref:FxsA family protein n=1 Tax=Lysinibacillus sp. 54212 TaxID=3119829 RepID=UPI002FCBCFF6